MTRDLKNALSSLGASVRARSEAKAPTHTVQLELPIWPEATRGVPNAALRCALFTARGKGRRGSPVDKLLLASTDGLRIYFTGTPLDQADLDVWEECLNRAMRSGMGVRIEFTAQKFLKAIGRSTGGKDVAWLKEAFRRLAICLVEIEDGKRTYFGHLIEGGALDEQTGQYVIAINEDMVKLYGIDGWTQIEWNQRRALKGQPIAQWLHGFYATHAEPFAMKVESIRALCGSAASEMFHFRSNLREALGTLAEVTGWAWAVDETDLVHVVTRPTASQRRHLARRGKKRIAPMVARDSADGGAG